MNEFLEDKFRILSIDGGGVRGYLSATLLANIETYLDERSGESVPLGTRFDLIVGTSVGGLLALGLALGLRASELRDHLESLVPVVFGRPKSRIANVWNSRYSSALLESELQKILGDATLRDLSRDVCVTAVSLMDAKPRLHKTGYLARNSGRLDETLVGIARATSAAPTYFPAANLKYSENLVDGGLTANNPSVIALIESLQFERESLRGTPAPSLEQGNAPVLLSVGTGELGPLPYNHGKLIDGGMRHWALPIHEVLMASQSQLAHFQAKFFLRQYPGHYFRANPVLNSSVKLDDHRRFRELRNRGDIDADCEDFLRNCFLHEHI